MYAPFLAGISRIAQKVEKKEKGERKRSSLGNKFLWKILQTGLSDCKIAAAGCLTGDVILRYNRANL